MKNFIVFSFLSIFLIACGGDSSKKSTSARPKAKKAIKADDGKGVGEIKNVKLNNPLDEEMVKKGLAIYDTKCSACHKKSAKRVVGPGFKGVTERRKPEWTMNMITNTGAMLDKDPEAQKLLEECLTRMPNQNVSVEDARALLEFLYSNDAKG